MERLPRLQTLLGGAPRLLIKRDDAIAFGFGGNKVRKLALVGACALADGADTLITAGGVQSNHARATAATAVKLGMRAVLVANGAEPDRLTANALLDALLGAEVVYVGSREARAPMILEIAERLRAAGRRPFAIPIGASTPLGALGFVLAMAELVRQMPPPDVIVHATSSGGTQAGLVAGCRLLGLPTRIVGISADESSMALQSQVRAAVRLSRSTIGSWATATACRPMPRERRSSLPPGPKRFFWIRRTRPKRWPASSHTRASRSSSKTRRCCSGTREGRSGCSLELRLRETHEIHETHETSVSQHRRSRDRVIGASIGDLATG